MNSAARALVKRLERQHPTGPIPLDRCAKCSLLADIAEPVVHALTERFSNDPLRLVAALNARPEYVAYMTVDHEPTCGA